MMFPYSLKGAAKTWYEKEPPNSILTWEDLVTKFVNQFFPPSKTTHLKNEISLFTQKFEETFSKAWERFKELLRACPHHGFTELTQVDIFYNGLNENEQDSLNARWMSATSSKMDERIDKLSDQLSTLVEIVSKKVVTPAPVKAVEESCVTCGGATFLYKLERETEETTDKEQTNFQGSTAQMPPPVIPISIPEPDVLTTLPKTTPITESNIPKNLPKPNIPYPSRRDNQKSRDKASNQMEKIFQIFQDLRFDISFADALLLMPRFAPTIKSLLMNNEKLIELAKIPLNEIELAMLSQKASRKLEIPTYFHNSCNFPGMDVCHALADLGASINLMPLSIWKKLSLPDLTPTRMTLELADRSITHPKGLAEDIFVKVGISISTVFLLSISNDINPLFDEELEDIECKDSYDSNLDESTFLVTPLSDSNKDKCLTPRDDIEILLHDDPSTPLKNVASILEGFINDPPFEENEFDLECKTNDEAECFNPGGDNDEIDAFLAIEVPTYIEGYYDSEGDVLYLESLLSEDTTHNLSPEVFFDHEPQQLRNEPENEPLITFSPNSSFSQSPKIFQTIIESLPTSTTLIEDSDPNREEIDIFSGPDDSIPPGIESDFDSEEDIIDNLLNDDSTHERLTFNIEPDAPVINNVDELNEDECFNPVGGKINVEVDDSFTIVTRTFLSFLTYPEVSPLLSSSKNEDTIYDPDISTCRTVWRIVSGMELHGLMCAQTLMKSRIEISFPFNLLRTNEVQGIGVKLCDSVLPKTKRFVGGTPCLSIFYFSF
ncbi:reverse transcriptase domain-containing protein [Tanacetum coccineum]